MGVVPWRIETPHSCLLGFVFIELFLVMGDVRDALGPVLSSPVLEQSWEGFALELNWYGGAWLCFLFFTPPWGAVDGG